VRSSSHMRHGLALRAPMRPRWARGMEMVERGKVRRCAQVWRCVHWRRGAVARPLRRLTSRLRWKAALVSRMIGCATPWINPCAVRARWAGGPARRTCLDSDGGVSWPDPPEGGDVSARALLRTAQLERKAGCSGLLAGSRLAAAACGGAGGGGVFWLSGCGKLGSRGFAGADGQALEFGEATLEGL
jgi:hypothetical protein